MPSLRDKKQRVKCAAGYRFGLDAALAMRVGSSRAMLRIA
jgi:hypothetical protein